MASASRRNLPASSFGEVCMSSDTIVVTAIVAAYVIFMATLFWAQRQAH